jgi:ABC-type bacteriocin/lantibiotic exporter with double-glycine peptidase domain
VLSEVYSTSSRINNWKLKIVPIMICSTIFDFVGTILVYPLINILGGMPTADNQIIIYFYRILNWLGLAENAPLLLVLILSIFILKAILQVGYRTIAASEVLQWSVDIRRKIYSNIFSSIYSTINEDQSRLTNSLTTQTDIASGAIYQCFHIWPSIFLTLSSIVLANIFSWQLFVLLIAAGAIIYQAVRFANKLSLKYGVELVNLNKNLFSIIGQAIKSYRYLKSTFLHSKLFDDFDPIIQNVKKVQLRSTILNAITSSINEPITILIVVLLFGLGKLLDIPSGILVIQAIILYRLFTRALPLASELQNFSKSFASLNYIDSLINELEKKNESVIENTLEGKINSLDFNNISYKYENKTILDKSNLNIKNNGLTLIMGESGSGKTTFLNLITGLLKPSNGNININNIQLGKINLNDYRSRFGLLGQDPLLFNMSLIDNLRLRNNEIEESVIIQWLDKLKLMSLFADNVIDLNVEINEMSSNLSSGQKQRLCFIREILSNPEVFILDEPTSALDENSKMIILDAIKELKENMLIIVVTHDKDFRKIADNIYHLDNDNMNKI